MQYEVIDPREFATDKHGTVDDRPYGGGPGMVMTAPIMTAQWRALKTFWAIRHLLLP